MIKRLCILTVFMAVSFTISATAQHAWGETENVSELQDIQPGSCWQEMVELQNVLHAANQTIESLASENRALRETIQRIRREINRGGYEGFNPALDNQGAH